VSAHAGADTRAGELTPHGVSRPALEPLHQNGNGQGWRVSDQQMHVVGFAVELHQLDSELGAHRMQGVLTKDERRVQVFVRSVMSVNSLRRNLVMNTRCACSNDTLCRARR